MRKSYMSYMSDFKIEQARSASSICNHKCDFRPKLHDTGFNDHFITSIPKSPKCRNFGQFNYFYWCSTEPVWNEIRPFFFFLGGGIRVWKQKLQNLPHDTCLSFSWNLIGFFKQALKSDWLFCFQRSLLIGSEKDAISSKKWCDSWINRTN